MAGIASLVMFAVSAVALFDLFTQVWVMRPGTLSGEIYLASGICFIVFSLIALGLCIKLRMKS
jgi:drug/metabolite transporter superfamily protein YnfA